jgi:hypothetical protein
LDLQFAQPFTIGAAYLTGMRRAKAGKEWLRRSLPESAWRGLHRANVKLRGIKKDPEENKIG